MKPVIPPRRENPFQGALREFRDAREDDIRECYRSIRFVFKGLRP